MRERSREGADKFRAFKFKLCGVEGLAREFQFRFVACTPAFFAKIQIEPLVMSVKFVSDDAVPDVLRMRADLMFASGVKCDARQRIAVLGYKRFEKRDGVLRVRTVADALFDQDRACRVAAQGRINELRFSQFAFQNRQICFGDPAAFDGFLGSTGSIPIQGNQNNPAGFAVQAADKMQCFRAEPFPSRADKTRPRSVFRRMTNDPARLVKR